MYQTMELDKAAELYFKLKPFLRMVEESLCGFSEDRHIPGRCGYDTLHHQYYRHNNKYKPYSPKFAIMWSTSSKYDHPTFEQFLDCYCIKVR